MKNNKELNDILILITLPFVLIGVWFFTLNGEMEDNYRFIFNYFSQNREEIFLIFVSLIMFWVFSGFFVLNHLGINKFGKKIDNYKKNRKTNKISPFVYIIFILSCLTSYFFRDYLPMKLLLLPFPKVIPAWQTELVIGFLDLSQIVFSGFICSGIFCLIIKFEKLFFGKLPKVPNKPNTLVIGTKITEDKESWILLGQKSLVTGLMTTASTGSGKSSACLLPWTKQILERFDPRPSVIVIDPKNSFANDVLRLSKDMGLEEHVIYFDISGEFRTNVLYHKDILKSGNYSCVSSMLQAATENYIGKQSGDGRFWGQKGYVFIKNMVIFCGGKFGDYFTLKDFYEEATQIKDRDFGLEIEDFLSRKDYNWEEKRNLEITASYFNNEFTQLDDKFKDSILVTATSFLSLLRDAKIERVFCPEKEEVNFWGFDEIVDKGKIFIFGINIPGLSGPMSIFMKLMYQRSVLNRITHTERLKEGRLSFGIYDEYQSIVTLGGGQIEGDDDYSAKRREALGVTIVATQSLSSLMQSIGSEVGLEVLTQNFRNKVIGHSMDKRTVEYCKYFAGDIEQVTESQSYSESGSSPHKNFIDGNLHTVKPTVSQSLNQNVQKVSKLNGEKLSTLKLNEAIGFFFDGVNSFFVEKVGLKPAYLKSMRINHKKVIKITQKALPIFFLFMLSPKVLGYTTICSAVKQSNFDICQEHITSACTCGPPPRPCTFHSYYIVKTFIEVTTEPKNSFFSDIPGAALQLSLITDAIGHGSEEMDSYFYNARIIQAPFSQLGYEGMACGGSSLEKLCFDAISEQIGSWKTGIADMSQPLFKVWSAAPKICLKKGIANAITGDPVKNFSPGNMGCGFPLKGISVFPPSRAENCTGWGVLMPRTGFVEGSSTMGAALLVAKRIRSLAAEVYGTTSVSYDEKWSLVYPNNTYSCFLEGKSIGEIEVLKGGNERGRLLGKNHKSFLFAIWQKKSCCKDTNTIITTEAAKSALKAMCLEAN